jgi:hypothetical protein
VNGLMVAGGKELSHMPSRRTAATLLFFLGIALLLSPGVFFRLVGASYDGDASYALAVRIAGIGLGLVGALLLKSTSAGKKPEAPPVRLESVLEHLKTNEPEIAGRFADEQTLETVADQIMRRRKIEAIKVIREASSCGLKEAKELAEELEAAIKRVQASA